MSADPNRWFETEIFVYEGRLKRFIAQYVSRDDRGDVLQEIYERVLKFALLQPIANPAAYLRTVASSVVCDRARKRASRKGRKEEELREEHYPVDGLTPEHRVIARERLARVKECLSRLPDRARQAVWLHKHLGLSQQETALRMGITEGAVEQRLVAGMRKLAECCHGADSEDELT